jgi:hypothetical protein
MNLSGAPINRGFERICGTRVFQQRNRRSRQSRSVKHKILAMDQANDCRSCWLAAWLSASCFSFGLSSNIPPIAWSAIKYWIHAVALVSQ